MFRRGSFLVFLTGLLLCSAFEARAAPLTCDAFKARLSAAILDSGNKIVPVETFTLAYANPEIGKRYDWNGPSGLSGSMNCGRNDEFEDFDVEFDPGEQAFSERLAGVVGLAAASMCAVSSGAPAACADLSRRLLKSSIEKLGSEYSRKTPHPSGITRYSPLAGLTAQLTASPLRITFTIGPGAGSSVDEARQALIMPNVSGQ